MKRSKRIFSKGLFIVGMVISLVACSGSHEGEAKTPSGSSAQKGRDYQEVEQDFKESGFTNIKSIALEDLVLGLLNKEGSVDMVTVGGDENYSPDKWLPADTEVIINYHSFPQKDSDNESIEDQYTEVTDDAETIKESTAAETIEQTEDSEALTPENCADFAEMLEAKSEFDNSYTKFAARYKNETIEFEACIINVMNHENYNTRYDILLSAGDFVDENTANPGPIFKFSDVGTSNLGIHDLYLPSFISEGSNVHVIASVDKFNDTQGVFLLKPISVTAR